MKKAFTLIELLMVIALIAIVSTLAVNKLGGIRESAARKVSLANQKSVGRAVEAFLVSGGMLNRLDNLFYADCTKDAEQSANATPGSRIVFDAQTMDDKTLYFGPSSIGSLDRESVAEKNSGLHPDLLNLLCMYRLNEAEAIALRDRIGLKYVVRHYEKAEGYPSYNGYSYGDDGSVPGASDGLDPNLAACITKVVTNGLLVAAISPASHLGRTVYQAFGEEYLSTKKWTETYSDSEIRAEVDLKGGLLLAFGLNDMASIVGNPKAGLESVPYATHVQKKYYSRYILLFRMKTAGSGSVAPIIPEFVGVLDCEGNTLRAAEHIIKRL
jgi:prepilin-type N-terminal cleavage/methylation domain-containing protein